MLKSHDRPLLMTRLTLGAAHVAEAQCTLDAPTSGPPR